MLGRPAKPTQNLFFNHDSVIYGFCGFISTLAQNITKKKLVYKFNWEVGEGSSGVIDKTREQRLGSKMNLSLSARTLKSLGFCTKQT